MKCPKCSYIGFEPTDRCRNCGYDFSLSPAPVSAEPDLPMRSAEPLGPMADFDLGEARRPPKVTPNTRAARRRQDHSLDPGVVPPAVTPSDLPLFGELTSGGLPRVPSASPAPLSVRRSTPVATRTRTPLTPRPERFADVTLPLDTVIAPPPEVVPRHRAAPAAGDVAGLGCRAGAAALDWVMLVAIDLAVVYFTLRVSRLPMGEFGVLPPAPLAAFLLLLNGGYLALFTAAGGQTIGKMAFGLKVISHSEEPLTVGRSLVRVAGFLLGAAAAGIGLLPAAFDGAHRGLHDRLADTRVVRAS